MRRPQQPRWEGEDRGGKKGRGVPPKPVGGVARAASDKATAEHCVGPGKGSSRDDTVIKGSGPQEHVITLHVPEHQVRGAETRTRRAETGGATARAGGGRGWPSAPPSVVGRKRRGTEGTRTHATQQQQRTLCFQERVGPLPRQTGFWGRPGLILLSAHAKASGESR